MRLRTFISSSAQTHKCKTHYLENNVETFDAAARLVRNAASRPLLQGWSQQPTLRPFRSVASRAHADFSACLEPTDEKRSL